MKSKLKIFIVFVVLTFLTVLVGNKTFLAPTFDVKTSNGEKIKIPVPLFSFYMDTDKENTFYTFRRTNIIRASLSKYLESLETCYDESYFYDSDLNITIFKYYVEDEKPFNKIYLDYQFGNYCKNEYILDKDWISEFQDKAKLSEIKLETCEFGKCEERDVDQKYIDDLMNYMLAYEREELTVNIGVKVDTKYVTSVYYSLNNKSYMLNIFEYDDYLAFKIINQDDQQKNAIYKINDDIVNLLGNIYKN